MDLRNSLNALNAQLAVQGTRLRIEQRGQSLNLRGPLPLRDEPSKTKVQRISLGLRADAAGLQEARETLDQVQRQLDRERFNWEDWQTTPRGSTGTDADAAIGSFEQAFFNDPRRRRQPHHLEWGLPPLSQTPAPPQR